MSFQNPAVPQSVSVIKHFFEMVPALVEKFDYRNHAADWKNSKDAVQRGMQKLTGGYPADDPYKMK